MLHCDQSMGVLFETLFPVAIYKQATSDLPFYCRNNFIMEKQKLAEMVMEKMRLKREQEERNRPHYEVLRLEGTFQAELNAALKQSTSELQCLLAQTRATLAVLQAHLNDVDNTGKRSLPRIVVLPEFIASEKISADCKDFYRKSSNSFLRTDLLRTRGYEQAVRQQSAFLESLSTVRQLEDAIANAQEQHRNTGNAKRVRVLKEDLRLRAIREEQRILKKTIEEERNQNADLLREYEIKKVNLQSRKDRLKYVEEQIVLYRNKIEQAFNPLTYRTHLNNVFAATIKNQAMHGSLKTVSQRVQQVDAQARRFEQHLEKSSSLVVLGRRSDSPAAKRGSIQKRLQQERACTPTRPQTHRAHSSSHQSLALDLSGMKQLSSAKGSLRTTDRSQGVASIARSLF